nr:hypothetical protein [Tanacetum cinerariifolium]
MIKKEKSEKLGRVPTEMELILEHTQQGISHKVSVSTEGVEALKRNDKIKGVKKEALLRHLGKNRVNTYAIKNTKVLFAPTEHILHSPTTYQQKRKTQTRRRTQKDTELPRTSVPMKLGVDEAVNQEESDRVERAITTDGILEVAQDSDNITKTQTTTIPNVDIPQGIDTGGRPRHQEIMQGTSTQTSSERVLEQPNEPTLTEGHTSRSGEDRLKENIELTNTIPTPYDSPPQEKRSKAVIHSSYKKGLRVHIDDSPKLGRIIEEMDKDENINLEEAEVQGDSDQEVEELKLSMRIIPEEDIAIEAIPLAIKLPMIIEFKNLHIFLLVDKVYPRTLATIKMMLERKLQADQWKEMCYQLLKLMMKQLRKQ